METLNSIKPEVEPTTPTSFELAKNTVKGAVSNYFSDTPKWAKIVRFVGLGFGALGGALVVANPVTLPAILVTLAPYMTLVGNFTALFVQGFAKDK